MQIRMLLPRLTAVVELVSIFTWPYWSEPEQSESQYGSTTLFDLWHLLHIIFSHACLGISRVMTLPSPHELALPSRGGLTFSVLGYTAGGTIVCCGK
jgi:hypothetical protein